MCFYPGVFVFYYADFKQNQCFQYIQMERNTFQKKAPTAGHTITVPAMCYLLPHSRGLSRALNRVHRTLFARRSGRRARAVLVLRWCTRSTFRAIAIKKSPAFSVRPHNGNISAPATLCLSSLSPGTLPRANQQSSGLLVPALRVPSPCSSPPSVQPKKGPHGGTEPNQ